MTINLEDYSVTVGGCPVLLTKREMDMLWTLASGKIRAYTREMLLDLLWGYDYYNDPEKEIIGAVLLHFPASGVDEAVLQGMSALALGVVSALIFAGLAAFWLSYRFTAPLRRMNIASMRLADGDYTAQTGTP